VNTQPFPEPPPLDDVEAVLAWAKAGNDRAEKVLDEAREYLERTSEQ
jgi:predicted NBD/HSP70 family sugar kinase